MNVLQNLVELYNRLPLESTYREVVKGILENLEVASNATIYDIAELTNSSRTTVWRMVQKMGYDNYSDFKYALKQAVGNYVYYNRMIPMQKNIKEEDIIPELVKQTEETARLMKDIVSLEKMKDVAKKLKDADKISFFFPYQSCAISSLQQNLAMTGKETGYFCLFPDMLENAKTLSPKSIVFFETIEHAETMDLIEVFQCLKEKGVEILMVSCEKSRYQEYVNENIFPVGITNAVVSNLVLIEMYFFTLSELYRKLYIGI